MKLSPMMWKKLLGFFIITVSSFYLFEYFDASLPTFGDIPNLVLGLVVGLVGLWVFRS